MNATQTIEFLTIDHVNDNSITIMKNDKDKLFFSITPINYKENLPSETYKSGNFETAEHLFTHMIEAYENSNYKIAEIKNIDIEHEFISKPEQIEIIKALGLNDVVIE